MQGLMKREFTIQKKKSLDEEVIPWRSRLKFRTYNRGITTNFGVLVRTVCEAVSGCICDMETCATETKKLENTVSPILDKYLAKYRHI
jgi:hypothetical protein